MIEDAKDKIAELVERFDRKSDVYKNGSYNETQVRREFIEIVTAPACRVNCGIRI
ncbi:MAG: hypothetical protein HY786_00365 [Deltaproteobacteria bacterium]|nr:hypothetical protein [Deltaproteobacteria bacterium]